MAQATRDPSSFRNNVMLKQEGSGMGFYGYVPLGRRHLLYHGLCQVATTPGQEVFRQTALFRLQRVPALPKAVQSPRPR